MPALARKHRTNYSAFLAIQVGRKLLTQSLLRSVQNVTVNLDRKKAATLKIVIKDPDYFVFDRDVFGLNTVIHVYCGWSDEVVRKGPFKVTGYNPVYPDNAAPYLTIEAKDFASTKLKKNVRSRTWNGKTAKEVIQAIAKEQKLKTEIYISEEDNAKFTDERSLTQAAESDSRLMQRVADKLGYVWGINEGTLYFARPESANRRLTNLHYKSGDYSIKSFNPKFKVFTKGGKGVTHTRLIGGNIDFFQDFGSFYNDLLLARVPVRELEPGEEYDPIFADIDGRPLTAEEFTPLGDPVGLVGIDGFGFSYGDGKDTMNWQSSLNSGTSPRDQESRRNRYPQNTGDSANEDSTLLEEATSIFTEFTDKVSDFGSPFSTDVFRTDEGQEYPGKSEVAIRHLGKGMRDAVVESADIIPTVPSWVWDAHDAVNIQGTHKKTSGIYEIHKVTLSYDKDKGLSTRLNGKKRVVSKGKGKGGDAPVREHSLGGEENDDNPRRTQDQHRPRTVFFPDLRDEQGDRGVFINEPTMNDVSELLRSTPFGGFFD